MFLRSPVGWEADAAAADNLLAHSVKEVWS